VVLSRSGGGEAAVLIRDRGCRNGFPLGERSRNRPFEVADGHAGDGAPDRNEVAGSLRPAQRDRSTGDGHTKLEIGCGGLGNGDEESDEKRGQRPADGETRAHLPPPASVRIRCSNSASAIDRLARSPRETGAATADGSSGGGVTFHVVRSAEGT